MLRHQVIEKNIPFPEDKNRWPTRYGVRDMKVGDSFVHIDEDAKTNLDFWNRVGMLYSYAKRYDFKVKVRKVSNRAVRVWRIK